VFNEKRRNASGNLTIKTKLKISANVQELYNTPWPRFRILKLKRKDADNMTSTNIKFDH
jgi:hypothetical protein